MALSVTTNPGTNLSISGTGVYNDPRKVVQGQAPTYYYTPGGTNGVVGNFSTTAPSQNDVLGASTVWVDPTGRGYTQPEYNNLVSGFNTQKSNIFGTATDAANNAYITRKSNILDFLQQLKTGQQNIDEQAVQNELAKKQGYTSIQDMVGRGLRSGAVMLGNRNALDSSASEALARAYGSIGQRQLGSINNQYELQNRNIGLEQQQLGEQRATGLRKFDEGKTQSVNNIVADARDRLAQLDAAMANASLPDRINIEQEKNRIKGDVLDILSKYDQELNQGANAIAPTSLEARRQTAFGLANAGTAATNPFQFTTDVNAQFQNTGPFSSGLPIFTLPRKRQGV